MNRDWIIRPWHERKSYVAMGWTLHGNVEVCLVTPAFSPGIVTRSVVILWRQRDLSSLQHGITSVQNARERP